MKKLIFFLMLFTVLFSACGEVDLSQVSDEDLERISDKAVVCEKPYIRVGIECCLDEDDNGICDTDDRAKEENFEDEYLEEEFIGEDDFYDDEDYFEDDEFIIKFDNDYGDEVDERVYLEAFLEGDEVILEWEADIAEEDFKYYKVMLSYDNEDPKYPEDDAIGVIDKFDETEFAIYDKFEDGYNYFRISVVLANDDVIHSNVIKGFYEDDYEEYDEIYVEIFKDGFYGEIEFESGYDEFEGDLTDIVEIKKFISEEFELDYDYVVDNLEYEYVEEYLFKDDDDHDHEHEDHEEEIEIIYKGDITYVEIELDGINEEFELETSDLAEIIDIISEKFDLDPEFVEELIEIEEHEEEEIEIEVTLFSDGSEIEVEINGEEEEFELETTDLDEIIEKISEEYGLDIDFVEDIMEVEEEEEDDSDEDEEDHDDDHNHDDDDKEEDSDDNDSELNESSN